MYINIRDLSNADLATEAILVTKPLVAILVLVFVLTEHSVTEMLIVYMQEIIAIIVFVKLVGLEMVEFAPMIVILMDGQIPILDVQMLDVAR